MDHSRARMPLVFLLALGVCAWSVHAGTVSQIAPDRIWFDWSGHPGQGGGAACQAVTMEDACSSAPIPTPEYDAGAARNGPAAFARGSALTVQVQWKTSDRSLKQATVWATGDLGGFPETTVTFKKGVSDWVTMRAAQPLPDSIEVFEPAWDWHFRTSAGDEGDGGTTTHTIYLLNKAPLTSPVYLDLVRWTTNWCSGLPDDAKDIADAIIAGFARTGVIKYGYPGWSTRHILCKGGGMCGGMQQVFYDACGTQGVHVARSCYILKDADPDKGEYKWKSMIIYAPGIGNELPTFEEQTIRQVNGVYPNPRYEGDDCATDDVEIDKRKVYEFFAPNDGHCINFLEYQGKVYLYDLSFGTGPWPGTFDALPTGTKQGPELKGFRDNYMNQGIDYMRGKIYYLNNSELLNHQLLDVKSSIIPDAATEFRYDWSTQP